MREQAKTLASRLLVSWLPQRSGSPHSEPPVRRKSCTTTPTPWAPLLRWPTRPIARREFEPYGRQLQPATLVDGPDFTGHVSDAATGLVYMQQRYYDPGIGRMLSRDPVTAFSSGDMRHFNVYAYANNNPYKFKDTDGRRPDGIGSHLTPSEMADGQDFTFAIQSGDGPETKGRWTAANFEARLNAAMGAVEKAKAKMESTPYKTESKAANAFHRTMQPVSSRYGVEIESLISRGAGSYNLFGTGVGQTLDPRTGIGYTVNGPSNGMPTVHSHPVPSYSPNQAYPYPFSVPDYDWNMAASPQFQYISTPNGVYRFDSNSRHVEDISE